MVIIKFKLMRLVQAFISLCAAHLSAGTLYRVIHEQLKDPFCPLHLLWVHLDFCLLTQCFLALQARSVSSSPLFIGIFPGYGDETTLRPEK